MLMMWIGELMTEFGIGNGVSILIFAGIVARIPSEVGQLIFSFDVSLIPLYLLFVVAGLLVVAGGDSDLAAAILPVAAQG